MLVGVFQGKFTYLAMIEKWHIETLVLLKLLKLLCFDAKTSEVIPKMWLEQKSRVNGIWLGLHIVAEPSTCSQYPVASSWLNSREKYTIAEPNLQYGKELTRKVYKSHNRREQLVRSHT